VVYPEGTGSPQGWTDDPKGSGHAADVAFLRQVISDATTGGCGDRNRVIVTGISQGGWLSDAAGCDMSDVVDGVVPVAGRDMGWRCRPARPIPFAAVNGVLDDVLPYDGGAVNVAAPVTTVDSAEAWAADRAASRGCTGPPKVSQISAHVDRLDWSGCAAAVSLYRVKDGGHSWPSGGGNPPVDHELSVTKVIEDMIATVKS
jgi:polyhydroxybutyrate depolymerase